MLFVRLHGNRRTWVDCGWPGVPTGCAFKWPVWGVPLNDDAISTACSTVTHRMASKRVLLEQ